MNDEPLTRVFGEEEPLFGVIDGKEYVDEESALAILLADGVLFSNFREYGWDGRVEGRTTILFVNCNDVFAWGCADAESLPHKQIGPLLKMHLADETWGAIKWCCIQRQQRPQPPVERDMRAAGAWDGTMEALPLNADDKALHAALLPSTTGEQYDSYREATIARAGAAPSSEERA